MNRKTLILLGIAGVLALGVAATDVNAVCSPAQQFLMAFSATGNPDNLLVFPGDANVAVTGGVVKGRWWQAGNRTLHNEGADCPEAHYLIQADGTTSANAETVYGLMGGDWGTGISCGGIGCPTGTLILLVQTQSTDGTKAYYAVGKTVQQTAGEFDFTRGGVNWPVVEVPRPRVTASSRAATVVSVNLVFDPPAGARGESDGFPPESILSGYQVVSFSGTGDPGRAAGLWTNLGGVIPVTNTGATVAGVQVDCSNVTNDVFLATRPVFDGGQFSGDYVSASTRVECDPTLADPRFKMIDKSKSGRGTTRPNNQ